MGPITNLRFSGPTAAGEFVEFEVLDRHTVRMTREDAPDWQKVIDAVRVQTGLDLCQGKIQVDNAEMNQKWRGEIERQLFDLDHSN